MQRSRAEARPLGLVLEEELQMEPLWSRDAGQRPHQQQPFLGNAVQLAPSTLLFADLRYSMLKF